jgi:hypothetical protein
VVFNFAQQKTRSKTMKKMIKYAMMLTVGMVMAGSVQAAAINWSAPLNAMRDSTGAVLNGAVVLLMQVANGGAAPVFGWDGNLTISGGNYLGQTVLNGTGFINPATAISITGDWNVGTINVVGGAAYGEPATVATAGFGALNGLDYYMIVFDGNAISGASTYATSVLLNRSASTISGNLGLIFTAATGASSTWTPVPEPTSFALVGLGAVVLALRRRFAK